MHPINHQVKMPVIGIAMQPVKRLMRRKAQFIEKELDRLLHLRRRRLFARPPTQHIMTDRIGTAHRLIRQRQHLQFLIGARGGEHTACACVNTFLLGSARKLLRHSVSRSCCGVRWVFLGMG